MSIEDSTADQTHSNISDSTTDYIRSSPSSFDPAWQIAITVEFYFQYAIIAIGIFGTAANALVLYALVMYYVQEAKKRAINLLLINQNLLDLLSCILLVVTYSIAVNKIYLRGALGYFICIIFLSESATYSSLYGSVINLTMLTLERYLKVVHPFWSRKNLKRWMIHVAMVFAWISGISFAMPVVFATTLVQDGVCLSYFVWESPVARMMCGAATIVCFFLVPLVVFVYCYGHIVVVMRRQMKVMAGHGEGNLQANAAQVQSRRIKWNIIKTMIVVSVAFVVCWTPNNVYFMIVDSHLRLLHDRVYFMIVDPDHRVFHDRGLHRTNQRRSVDRLLPHSVSGLSQRLHESIHLRHEARRREAETSSSDVDLLQMQRPDGGGRR